MNIKQIYRNIVKKLQINHCWKTKDKPVKDTKINLDNYIPKDFIKNIEWFATTYGGHMPCYFIEYDKKKYVYELYTEFEHADNESKVVMNTFMNTKH